MTALSRRFLRAVFCVALPAMLACGGRGDAAKAKRGSAALTEEQRVERDAWLAAAGAQPGARPPCPADGRWAPCSVFDRLDRAGLAPRLDSAIAREPGMVQAGALVRVGSGELGIYLYNDSLARREDEQRLEKGRYIETSAQPTMRNEATLIRSNNLLGVLRSRSETQRERVALVLAAGAPAAR